MILMISRLSELAALCGIPASSAPFNYCCLPAPRHIDSPVIPETSNAGTGTKGRSTTTLGIKKPSPSSNTLESALTRMAGLVLSLLHGKKCHAFCNFMRPWATLYGQASPRGGETLPVDFLLQMQWVENLHPLKSEQSKMVNPEEYNFFGFYFVLKIYCVQICNSSQFLNKSQNVILWNICKEL